VILLVPAYSVGPFDTTRHSFGFGPRLSALSWDIICSMRMLLLLSVLALSTSVWARGTSAKDVIGSWEGDSKCTVPDSPCHDEHVLLQITADKTDPWQLKLDAYKIVDGSPDFMGTLTCKFHGSVSAMSCTGNTSQQDDWEFRIAGDTMTGRLTIGGGKTLYRRITLHKSSAVGK
jgi:hypothetical protein